jgi:hypothetical protein
VRFTWGGPGEGCAACHLFITDFGSGELENLNWHPSIKSEVSFGSRIRPMEMNSYSYRIAIPLFDCILFKGIVIPTE